MTTGRSSCPLWLVLVDNPAVRSFAIVNASTQLTSQDHAKGRRHVAVVASASGSCVKWRTIYQVYLVMHAVVWGHIAMCVVATVIPTETMVLVRAIVIR